MVHPRHLDFGWPRRDRAGHQSPLIFLEEEFFGALSSQIIADLATRPLQEAAEWSPVPPDAPAPADDPAAAARVALERLEADLKRIGLGHNQGPPLDVATVADGIALVGAGREAIEAGPRGVETAKLVQAGLLALASAVVLPFVKKLSEHAADDVYPHLKHSLAITAEHMLQAAAALGHWIASMPML